MTVVIFFAALVGVIWLMWWALGFHDTPARRDDEREARDA